MIFVDTNIVIDLLEPGSHWAEWSLKRLAEAAQRESIAASAIVAAECAGRFDDLGALRAALGAFDLQIEDVPLDVMFAAGQTFRRYRRESSKREKVLADFFIGAHAAHYGTALISRDVRLYRRYFPDLILISPETET